MYFGHISSLFGFYGPTRLFQFEQSQMLGENGRSPTQPSDHLQAELIGLDSYSRQVFVYLDPILIYISLLIDYLFEIRKIAVCFLWL